ncbi:MAG: response regulator [Acetobacteraceae bacterium]|nr:response regulator [Acetobacteraceae bacterium]
MATSALVDLAGLGILCIDDDPVMRAVIRAALAQRGCRDVAQANSAETALALCADRRFDLIICDYQMAGMTGLEFLQALREHGIGVGWPVIMLSAETAPAAIAAAQEFGVNAWVGKPISAQKLVERVGATLGLAGGAAAEALDPQTRELAERYSARLLADLAAIDGVLATIAYRANGRPETWSTMRRRLHTIAGQAGMFGYGLIGDLARRGHDLLRAAERNGPETALCQDDLARVLGAITTAMKRIGQNRMLGDGGEAGLRLLANLDGVAAPLLARLEASPAA